HRSVIVRPSFVTEIKHAVLIPKATAPVGTSTSQAVWLIGDELLRQTPTGTLIWRNTPIPGTKVVGWTNDSNRLLTTTNGRFFWTDLAAGSSTEVAQRLRALGLALPKGANITTVPQNSSWLILSTDRTISLFDLENDTVTVIASTTGPAAIGLVSATRNLIAWSAGRTDPERTELSVLDLNSSAVSTTTIPGQTIRLAWSKNGGHLGILQNTNALYLYDPKSHTFMPRANDVHDFDFTNDDSRLAALDWHSLEIFSFTTDDYWRFNIPDAENLKRVAWYTDGAHLILEYPDRFALLDLDDAGLENVQTITTASAGVYDERANTLYFISAGNIFSLVFPK
ncbi:MAG TPA: hypothetical protein VMC43_02755, partial [Candidatus Paceibacterota bacterium]|nr:hypothetical protein [Candidatus Paceibacterota bacterium]